MNDFLFRIVVVFCLSLLYFKVLFSINVQNKVIKYDEKSKEVEW